MSSFHPYKLAQQASLSPSDSLPKEAPVDIFLLARTQIQISQQVVVWYYLTVSESNLQHIRQSRFQQKLLLKQQDHSWHEGENSKSQWWQKIM